MFDTSLSGPTVNLTPEVGRDDRLLLPGTRGSDRVRGIGDLIGWLLR